MVTLYTLPACVQCDATKRFLKRHLIDFEEVQLQEDPGAMQMVKGMGYTAAPVVVVGERHWSGFRPDLIESLAA
jgi:glutaredoxin-like protein NrdH